MYSPDIADRYDFTVNQFEFKKKWLEDIQVIMNERADVELAYSKSLVKVANLCEKYTQKNNLEKGVTSIVMSVRSVVLTQSEQSAYYAQQLKTDVVNTLKSGIKKQQDDLRNLQQKVLFLKTELNRNLQDLERQKQEYYKNYKLMQKSKEQILSLQLQESNPIMAVLQENERLLQENSKIIEESVLRFNVFLDQYFTEIVQTSKIQDQMEDYRIELIKDSLLKTLVYQISAMKNVEYDTNQVSKKIENYVREDPKPVFVEFQDRMMLSKLNFANYISYVETECIYPHIDKFIYKPDSNQFESMEINKSLKRFIELFALKKYFQNSANSPVKNNQQNQIASKNQENVQQQDNYYKKLLEGIFRNQMYLDSNSIKKFKEVIDQNERELILFTIALHEFSMLEKLEKDIFHEKSMSDLIFLVCHVFDKIEQTKESDVVERCFFSFLKICCTYVYDQEKQQIFIESLQQHKILSTKDFWVQDTTKKINQAFQRDYGKNQISKPRQAEFQLKMDISKWKQMKFSQDLSISILNEIASNFRLEEEKRQFFENVILDKEKIIKKPIFGENNNFIKKREILKPFDDKNIKEEEEINKQIQNQQIQKQDSKQTEGENQDEQIQQLPVKNKEEKQEQLKEKEISSSVQQQIQHDQL
ncbi:hypothetical protein ABPG72_018856 [Tetrahymena utriculariae]